jgi:hypothetical protein
LAGKNYFAKTVKFEGNPLGNILGNICPHPTYSLPYTLQGVGNNQ